MGKHILILGGGFGGLAAANELRRGLPSEHKITLVDRQPSFLMGMTKLWILDGSRHVGENAGDRKELGNRGVDFLEGEVAGIDVDNKEVRVGRTNLGYDYLIIALGADYSPATTPGFLKHAKNLYTESGCAEIRDALLTFTEGTVTIVVCGLPFKCPPAPYEASMILDHILREKGVRERISLQLITPEPQPLGILGPDAGKIVINLLEERKIKYHPSTQVKEINRNSLVTEDGKEFQHDLVLGIPVHVVPSVLKDSGVVDQSGWIPVNPTTLATNAANVYAVGDCAGAKIPNGRLLPRAGSLAENQAKVVATNIIYEIRGDRERTAFDGSGVCYMEVGGGKAAPLQSNFYAQPSPKWEFFPPSVEGLQQKRRFLDERMKGWFT